MNGSRVANRRRCFAFVGVIVTTMVTVCGCGTARRNDVLSEQQLRSNPRIASGQRVFMEHCNQCHVGGGAGLAPAINNKSKALPDWLIKRQVRVGLGTMPSFSKDQITDERLNDLVTYIGRLREQDNRMANR